MSLIRKWYKVKLQKVKANVCPFFLCDVVDIAEMSKYVSKCEVWMLCTHSWTTQANNWPIITFLCWDHPKDTECWCCCGKCVECRDWLEIGFCREECNVIMYINQDVLYCMVKMLLASCCVYFQFVRMWISLFGWDLENYPILKLLFALTEQWIAGWWGRPWC